MYSLLANPIIPEIEGGMINPEKIGIALHVSYGASSIFKVMFGIFGALTYALDTNEFVAMNVAQSGNVVRYLVIMFLLLCTFSNFSLPCHVLFDKLDQLMECTLSANCGEDGKYYIFWLIFSRIVGVFFTVLIAVKMPYYAAVVAAVGSVTGTIITLVFPILFHLKLFWKHISIARRISELFLLVIGISSGVFVFMDPFHI